MFAHSVLERLDLSSRPSQTKKIQVKFGNLAKWFQRRRLSNQFLLKYDQFGYSAKKKRQNYNYNFQGKTQNIY
jgi:hypothetical protein